jgi:hypothetical protein
MVYKTGKFSITIVTRGSSNALKKPTVKLSKFKQLSLEIIYKTTRVTNNANLLKNKNFK